MCKFNNSTGCASAAPQSTHDRALSLYDLARLSTLYCWQQSSTLAIHAYLHVYPLICKKLAEKEYHVVLEIRITTSVLSFLVLVEKSVKQRYIS